MEIVEYWGDPLLNKFKCAKHEVKMSDFEYTSAEDGKTYLMRISNKGYHGGWHVIKSLIDDKLYASNNLWSWGENSEPNMIVIKCDISKEELLNTFDEDELTYINKIEFFDDIDKVIINCEESIKKHNENKYIIANTKYYLRTSTDCEDCWIQLFTKPYFSKKTNQYEITYRVAYGSHYGDTEEMFDTLDEAIEKCVEIMNCHYDSMVFDKKCSKTVFYDNFLSISKRNTPDKSFIEKLSNFGVVLCGVSSSTELILFNFRILPNIIFLSLYFYCF